MMAWEFSKLSNISTVQTGKWDANHASENGKYRFFTCAYNSFMCDTKRFEGDCLILPGNGVNVGEVFHYCGEFDAYQRTYVVCEIKIEPKFLYYHMKCYWRERNLNKQFGSATNYLKIGNFNEYEVSYPPLLEQKRIVAILDQVFADIDKARATAERNLKNARELFDSYLQQVFSQRGEGWEVKKVSEIADTCLGKMLDKKKNKGSPKPYLRNLNVQWFDITTSDIQDMRFEDSEYERYAIKKGDLVICEGGYPGRGAIWERDEDIFFQKALHRIRCHNKIYNRWILYYLYLSDCNGSLKSNFTGAGIQHFTGKALKQLSIPIPKEAMAKVYVKNIGILQGEIRLLEDVYKQKLTAIEELKKSILQKAFTGELTKSKGIAA